MTLLSPFPIPSLSIRRGRIDTPSSSSRQEEGNWPPGPPISARFHSHPLGDSYTDYIHHGPIIFVEKRTLFLHAPDAAATHTVPPLGFPDEMNHRNVRPCNYVTGFRNLGQVVTRFQRTAPRLTKDREIVTGVGSSKWKCYHLRHCCTVKIWIMTIPEYFDEKITTVYRRYILYQRINSTRQSNSSIVIDRSSTFLRS